MNKGEDAKLVKRRKKRGGMYGEVVNKCFYDGEVDDMEVEIAVKKFLLGKGSVLNGNFFKVTVTGDNQFCYG